jgi:hypothetical protein
MKKLVTLSATTLTASNEFFHHASERTRPSFADLYETKATSAVRKFNKTGEAVTITRFDHYLWVICVNDDSVVMDATSNGVIHKTVVLDIN